MLLKGSHAKVPYVASVKLNPNRPLMRDRFPGNLAFTENLHLEFDSLVTFFVGENGSGKSTLLEAMAVLARLPICGGSMNEVTRNHPFSRYGGRSLHQMSHGEAFLSVMQNRFHEGLFFMDEPESALSPQRQLSLLALMSDLVKGNASQFFIATHSPILLTFPNATILAFEESYLERTTAEETSHFQITRNILNNPQQYWRHLCGDE